MRPKLLISLATCLFLGAHTPQAASPAKEVEQAINVLNEAFQKRDADAIQRLMTDDHISVTPYYGGPTTKAQQIKNLPDLQLTQYTAEKLTVTSITKDVALVTYPLTMKGTFKGKEVAPRSFASAVWVNRGGKWLEAYYQETALEGK